MNTEKYKKIFTDNVRQRREENGVSISELSRRSGLPMAMLEALDRGEIPETMMVTDAWELAKVFSCEAHELFR